MKNKIKYFVLYPLMVLIVIATLTYDVKELIGLGQRVPFGSSYWKDSTNDAISTNKSIKLGTGDSLYYNGVVVTSGTGGGGIAAADNITFTGRDSTTDLWRFGDSVRFYDHVLFKDTVKVSNAIMIVDSVRLLKNLLLGTTSKIFTNVNTLYQMESAYEWQTTYSSSIMTLDSLNGLNLNYGVYTGSGTGLTNVDAITLKGQDTTHFARTDTSTTERIKSKVEFSDVVTFFISPVFSALVNFPNGINVTGTATFNGDLVPTWIKNNSSVNRDQYEKVKIVRVPLIASPPYSATTFTAAHGITNWRTVTSWTCLVQEDSLNLNINASVYGNDASTANIYYASASVDSINVRIRIVAAAVNLFNDTAKFRIIYSDYNR